METKAPYKAGPGKPGERKPKKVVTCPGRVDGRECGANLLPYLEGYTGYEERVFRCNICGKEIEAKVSRAEFMSAYWVEVKERE